MTPEQLVVNLKEAEDALNKVAAERAQFIKAAEAQLHYVNAQISRVRSLCKYIQKEYLPPLDEGDEWKNGKTDS